MADTPTLAEVIDHALPRGGSIRLVGDNHQLSAIAAGGILTDLPQPTAPSNSTRS